MTHSRLSLLAIATAVLLPIVAFAAPPPAVTGIGAAVQTDGKVRVTWKPSTATDIASYRIYESRMSILENDGAYDDFEATDGPVTEKILTDFVPSGSKEYFAVMAVNKAGEESAFFVEETSIDLSSVPTLVSSTPTQMASSAASSVAPTTPTLVVASSSSAIAAPATSSANAPTPPSLPDTVLHLLSVKSLSATRVALEFSEVIATDPETAGKAMTIKDPFGNPLAIESITVEGKMILLQTPRQTAGMVYEIRIGETLKGAGNGALDPVERSAFFQGHATGEAPATTGALPGTNAVLPDVMGFRMNAVPEMTAPGRSYTVTAEWTYDPATPTDAQIVVRQSRDGGKTFGAPQYLSRTVTGVKFPGVTPEPFGIAVTVMDAQGNASRGLFGQVFATGAASPPVASILTTPPSSRPLVSSGLGAGLALTVIAGGAAGWKRARRVRG